jgi:hypothetical protein
MEYKNNNIIMNVKDQTNGLLDEREIQEEQ